MGKNVIAVLTRGYDNIADYEKLIIRNQCIYLQFYFKVMNFNKLVSLVYEDNMHSLKGALHLGFKEEGNLKHHLRDPRTGSYVSIKQLGLFAEDAFSSGNAALTRRLLGAREKKSA